MKRLLIVANRLPVKVVVEKGQVTYQKSEGGLATGLDSLTLDLEKHWIGWPGFETDDPDTRQQISDTLERDNIHSIFLSEEDVELYYEGFSNNTVWPLFHYFIEYAEYNQQTWERYLQVNQRFYKAVMKVARPDDIIWIQDYHLMLLPAMLREDLPENEIGFFLHIPFPSYELFRTLPWRRELLEGLFGADLIGFHTFEYMRHFISSATRVTNYDTRLGEIYHKDRTVRVDAFPMGINYEKFHQATNDPKVIEQMDNLSQTIKGSKLILSVDRLDYSKGILQRLHAIDNLLNRYQDQIGHIQFLMLVVPSRDTVEHYANLKEEIDELVGKINGRYATLNWSPIHYYYRSFPMEELIALYKLADVCLVTSLRDGMNLVAKEYIASRECDGVLVLSEMTGAAIELQEAITVNPNNINEIADAVMQAIAMPKDEQQKRISKMQRRVQRQSVQRWANDFIDKLHNIHSRQIIESGRMVLDQLQDKLVASYSNAKKRLVMLDYDGTLVPFVSDPLKAFPDESLLKYLKDLSAQENTTVVLISGRKHETLNDWFKDVDVNIIAEHGIWLRTPDGWEEAEGQKTEWKPTVMQVFQEFVDVTPGAFIEEKAFGLAWHYRKCDPWIADLRAYQLLNSLVNFCTKNGLEILDGNKVIEVKNIGIDKGSAAKRWLEKAEWDFVMAIGDDRTDEDVFRELPAEAWGIKVGNLRTIAPYRMVDHHQVRSLLKRLISEGAEPIEAIKENTEVK